MKDKKFYDGISNYAQLDHGVDFIAQWLHWLLHKADETREMYGKDSLEYQMICGRLANQIGQYGKGGNFSIKELEHYDIAHGQAMSDANKYLLELRGIPLSDYIHGYNFTNIVPDKGNADGDDFKVISGGTMGQRPMKLPTPLTARVDALPTVSVQGVESVFDKRTHSTNLNSVNDLKKLTTKKY